LCFLQAGRVKEVLDSCFRTEHVQINCDHRMHVEIQTSLTAVSCECGYSCYRANCSGIGVEPAALLDQFEKLRLTITRTRFAATNCCCRFKAAALDLIDLYVSTMISSNY
jgi:hypothetical protein